MSYYFNNDIPIYLQVLEHIKIQIINKEFLPNQKIPSVREMSLMYEVNPNTIVKALNELENLGLIYTERTNGKFVTKDEDAIKQMQQKTIKEKMDEFFDDMTKLGLSKKEILDILKRSDL